MCLSMGCVKYGIYRDQEELKFALKNSEVLKCNMHLYVEKRRINNTLYYNFAYYQAFLDELTSRDSCYRCKYANIQRTGDITWGIMRIKFSSKMRIQGNIIGFNQYSKG